MRIKSYHVSGCSRGKPSAMPQSPHIRQRPAEFQKCIGAKCVRMIRRERVLCVDDENERVDNKDVKS